MKQLNTENTIMSDPLIDGSDGADGWKLLYVGSTVDILYSLRCGREFPLLIFSLTKAWLVDHDSEICQVR